MCGVLVLSWRYDGINGHAGLRKVKRVNRSACRGNGTSVKGLKCGERVVWLKGTAEASELLTKIANGSSSRELLRIILLKCYYEYQCNQFPPKIWQIF